MTPTVPDVTGEVWRALLKEVAPHVGEAYALSVLQHAVLLLQVAGSDLDGAAQRLVEENAAISGLLASVTGRIADVALAARLSDLVATERTQAAPDLTLTGLQGTNRTLRRALIDLQMLTETDPALADLERAIRAELIASTVRRRGPLDKM